MNKADKIKRKMAESMVRGRTSAENAKYGDLIKQTNEVQFLLAHVVLLRSTFIDKDYQNLLERATFGTLINLFKACAKATPSMYSLLLLLQRYKKNRDRLAHKMFSANKLTPAECKDTLILGRHILTKLYVLGKIPKKLRPKI